MTDAPKKVERRPVKGAEICGKLFIDRFAWQFIKKYPQLTLSNAEEVLYNRVKVEVLFRLLAEADCLDLLILKGGTALEFAEIGILRKTDDVDLVASYFASTSGADIVKKIEDNLPSKRWQEFSAEVKSSISRLSQDGTKNVYELKIKILYNDDVRDGDNSFMTFKLEITDRDSEFSNNLLERDVIDNAAMWEWMNFDSPIPLEFTRLDWATQTAQKIHACTTVGNGVTADNLWNGRVAKDIFDTCIVMSLGHCKSELIKDAFSRVYKNRKTKLPPSLPDASTIDDPTILERAELRYARLRDYQTKHRQDQLPKTLVEAIAYVEKELTKENVIPAKNPSKTNT